MNYKNFKLNKKNIYIGIFCFFTIIIFIAILCRNVKAQNISESSKHNMFFVQVVNYAMPIVKVNSFDPEDLAECDFSRKDIFFSLIGIDMNKPSSILSKEIVNASTFEYINNTKDIDLDSFKLDDKQVMLETDEDKTLPKKKTLNPAKPEVFIYHTHTTESYGQAGPDSLDESKNVCAVGDALQEELEKNYGIAVVHDKTVHNAYSYNKSYSRSGETVDKFLKQYGDFKLIIDMHRDSAENKKPVTTQINGKNVARVMFVMARKNPHFKENISVANSLIAISNKLYPGFCRGVMYYDYGTGYFNQNKSNNAVLIEVGANINTIDEAKSSSKYLARVIGEYINGKSE